MRDYIYIQGAPPYSTMPTDNYRRVKRKSKKVRAILSVYFCRYHIICYIAFTWRFIYRFWWRNQNVSGGVCTADRTENEAAYQFSWVKWQKKWKIQFEVRQSMVSYQSSIRPWCVIFMLPYSEVNVRLAHIETCKWSQGDTFDKKSGNVLRRKVKHSIVEARNIKTRNVKNGLKGNFKPPSYSRMKIPTRKATFLNDFYWTRTLKEMAMPIAMCKCKPRYIKVLGVWMFLPRSVTIGNWFKYGILR